MSRTQETKPHEHEFCEEEIKDDTMLFGTYRVGKCDCGTSRYSVRVQVRWLLEGLLKLEHYKKKREVESLTILDVVYLIKKNKAVNDYDKFTEEHAKLFLDNLDKYI